MSLFKRFAAGRPGVHLHSSGLVGDESTIGTASPQSFSQRQSIEKSRQYVSGYRDAGVIHTYQKDARSDQLSTDAGGADDKHHHKKHKGSQVTPRTSRIEHRATARIEAPHTSRVDTSSRSGAPRIARARSSFAEPQARRYNPYS